MKKNVLALSLLLSIILLFHSCKKTVPEAPVYQYQIKYEAYSSIGKGRPNYVIYENDASILIQDGSTNDPLDVNPWTYEIQIKEGQYASMLFLYNDINPVPNNPAVTITAKIYCNGKVVSEDFDTGFANDGLSVNVKFIP